MSQVSSHFKEPTIKLYSNPEGKNEANVPQRIKG